MLMSMHKKTHIAKLGMVAIWIQRIWRGRTVRKVTKPLLLKRMKAIFEISLIFKVYVMRWLKSFRAKKRKIQAVFLLQKITKGYAVRTKVVKQLKIAKLEANLAEIEAQRAHIEKSAQILLSYYLRKFIKKLRKARILELRRQVGEICRIADIKFLQQTWRKCK